MPAAHYACTTVICLSDMQHLVFLHLLFLQNTNSSDHNSPAKVWLACMSSPSDSSSTWMLLSADVIAHCFAGFNQRAAELDSDLCWLALFLDPRYKDIAVPQANPDKSLDKVCGKTLYLVRLALN